MNNLPGAEPIHAVVNDVINLGVPGFVHWQQVLVLVEVANVARILHTSGLGILARPQSDDKVACAVGIGNDLLGAG